MLGGSSVGVVASAFPSADTIRATAGELTANVVAVVAAAAAPKPVVVLSPAAAATAPNPPVEADATAAKPPPLLPLPQLHAAPPPPQLQAPPEAPLARLAKPPADAPPQLHAGFFASGASSGASAARLIADDASDDMK